MARRKELKGICNDLLDSFVSRYNDLNGYWALGKFQSYLQSSAVETLCFDLTIGSETNGKSRFPITSNYYAGALRRQLNLRHMPLDWVSEGEIKVQSTSSSELVCSIQLTSDLGRRFCAQRHFFVRPYDLLVEFRRIIGEFGPKNQKGE